MHSRSGDIGGWSISNNTLTGGSTTLNSNGTIECENLIANSRGSIGGWSIGSSGLNAGGINISSGGSISASGWSISGDGTATFNRLYASNSGTIGGWTIGSNSLTGSGLTLGTGAITGPNFNLGSGGLTFSSGGTSINAGGGTSLTESSTNLGGKNIKTRIEEITVGKITATYIYGEIAKLDRLDVAGIVYATDFQDSRHQLLGSRIENMTSEIATLSNNVNGKANKGTYTVTGEINGGAIPFSLRVEI